MQGDIFTSFEIHDTFIFPGRGIIALEATVVRMLMQDLPTYGLAKDEYMKNLYSKPYHHFLYRV